MGQRINIIKQHVFGFLALFIPFPSKLKMIQNSGLVRWGTDVRLFDGDGWNGVKGGGRANGGEQIKKKRRKESSYSSLAKKRCGALARPRSLCLSAEGHLCSIAIAILRPRGSVVLSPPQGTTRIYQSDRPVIYRRRHVLRNSVPPEGRGGAGWRAHI